MGFWDLCAPEAIVRALGGVCTDHEGKPIKYLEKVAPQRTIPAFLIGKSYNTYLRVLRRISKL